MNPSPGLVVASFGRQLLVQASDGQRWLCHPRGKKTDAVVGDQVRWSRAGDGGVIEAIDARRNLFFRQDEVRSKSFAANIDQIFILLAAYPGPNWQLLARALVAAQAAGIEARIGLNKADLGPAFERAWADLEPYRAMGTPCQRLSLTTPEATQLQALQAVLGERRTLVIGASGVGKSTLVNLLVPDAQAATASVSEALGSGRHTTTRTTLHWLDAAQRSALLDSPGFQTFGLAHVQVSELARWMPDLAAHLGQCRFANCSHTHEPGCAVMAALKMPLYAGGISVERYKIYSDLHAELSQQRAY